MPKIVQPLTDTRIKAAKPKDKNYKLTDGAGLYLLIQVSGKKNWRFEYSRPVTKTRNTVSFGDYPQTSLAEARERRDTYRKMLSDGIDPQEQKKAEEAKAKHDSTNTFRHLAEEWLQLQSFKPATLEKANLHLSYLYTAFGSKPINRVTPADVLAACRKWQDTGQRETANRMKMRASQIFRYAVATLRCEHDPTSSLRGALAPPIVKHRAAITEPADFAQLLLDIDTYIGTPVTQTALRLAPLLFVRPGELRSARWSDIDLVKGTWTFTPPKTERQTGIQLVVPLPTQAVTMLSNLHRLTGRGDYVFPARGINHTCMSEATVLQAIRRLGWSGDMVCGHGFRATARTILDEVLRFPVDLIELQLGHQVRDMHGRAYNRTHKLDDRRRMMQAWADYLDELKKAHAA